MRVALYCLLLISLSSCSSIFNGSTQKLRVHSDPEDAEIMLNGSFAGRTPTEVTIKRGKNYFLEIKKEGYVTSRVTTDKSLEPLFLLNIFIWPGFLIDLATGSAWTVDPELIHVTLDMMGGS
jgi:hypothetical protein